MAIDAALDADHAGRNAERAVEEAFQAHTSPAFEALVRQVAGVGSPEPPHSLATCEKVPTSDPERVENHPEGYRLVERVTDAREAIQASISRSRSRQRKVLALIGEEEVAHAKRLAMCGRRSVQLRCPEGLAAGCGSTENYVPVSCGSRLCPDCMAEKQGKVVGQYRDRVASWDNPITFRVSHPHRVSRDGLEDGIEALREAFGNLRRRVVPAEGTHQGKRWVWSVAGDGGEPADHYWKSALARAGRRDLAKRWEMKYVEQGKGIPFSEIVKEGIYGIDIKQKEDGRFNVHMHVLADCAYLPQAALAALWDDVMDAPVVDIRRVEDRSGNDREAALMETIGYAAKAPEFETAEDEAKYLTALKGSKLVQPFGELHGNTPEAEAALRCTDCGGTPAWWEYEGTIRGRHKTVEVVGDGEDGDRPPPE